MSDITASAADRRSVPLGLRAGILACVVLLFFAFASIVWTPYAADAADAGAALQNPGAGHWLGTDASGRDVLSLLMRGMLTAIVVSAIGVVGSAVVGLPASLMRSPRSPAGSISADVLLVPALLVGVMWATLFGPGPIGAMLAIAIAGVPWQVRAVRNAKASLSGRDDLAVARLAGLSRWQAVRRHGFGSIVSRVLGASLRLLGVGIVIEATLSLAGLATQAPGTSLGLMLRDALGYLQAKPLLAVLPGVAILAMVLSLNLVAHGLSRWADRAPDGTP